MLKLDEDAVICDLAETYNIYDYKQLPVYRVAVFVCGLRENSRIMMKVSQTKVQLDSMLLAGIADRLSLLLWQRTKDGQHGRNRPVSIVEQLTNKPKAEHEEFIFNSGEEFENARTKLLKELRGDNHGN